MTTLEQPPVRIETDQHALSSQPGAGLESVSLAERVAKITVMIDEGQMMPVAEAEAGTALQPRSMLAVLVYCYAAGIFASEAIAELMQEDTQFRALCGDAYPDWHQLRRFRRLNRSLIQHCLEELLAQERGTSADLALGAPCRPPRRFAVPDSWEPDPRSNIAREASDRLRRAAQLDSMALDE